MTLKGFDQVKTIPNYRNCSGSSKLSFTKIIRKENLSLLPDKIAPVVIPVPPAKTTNRTLSATNAGVTILLAWTNRITIDEPTPTPTKKTVTAACRNSFMTLGRTKMGIATKMLTSIRSRWGPVTVSVKDKAW